MAELSKTQIKRVEQHKDRWSSFGKGTGILDIAEKPTPEVLRNYALFKEFDDKFLERLSPDISIARWKKKSMLFEEGSYIDVAFLIVAGEIQVSIEKQRESTQQLPIFNRSRTMVAGSGGLKPSALAGKTVFQGQIAKQTGDGSPITYLASVDFNLPSDGIMTLGPGEIFGEIGALSGWPQSVTAKTSSECELVQIRVPALRLLRKRSASLKKLLDTLYKERALFSQLKNTPLFGGLPDSLLRSLVERIELVSCDPDEAIAKEGEPCDALYLVRSGFVKMSQRVGEGNIVVSYLSKGGILGDVELLIEGTAGWVYTANSKEYSELAKLSRADLKEILSRNPGVESVLWNSAVNRLKESGYSRRVLRQSEFLDTALGKGLVEGNSILVIDLNVCTRCDDCVRGCADTHGGIPRFVREGDKIANLLVTRACYHCEDPVCLVGCPTGAIRRADVGDVVEIDDKLCIGCHTCANNCPYDAITMLSTGETWPADAIPEGFRGKEKELASKCDLCYTDPAGPACVRSCPHGCATRVGNVAEFRSLLRE